MMINKGDSPQLALDRLDVERVTFARELRGFTKKELAEKIGKTPSAISQIERDIIKPDLETFIRIAMVLSLPTAFFMGRPSKKIPIQVEKCHFRSKRSTSLSKRKQSARKGDLLIDFIDILEEKGIIFPKEQITAFSTTAETPEQIEIAASDLRRQWGMGLGPIPNAVKLLESKGIFVLPLHNSYESVDAYSTWRGDTPCMLLSFSKTASRARFDAAHELGHLLMHEGMQVGDAQTEKHANRFSGAFLAPRESFGKECPRGWSFEAFKQLKFRWKLSISALLYRAKDLGKISASTYQRAMIDLASHGLNKNEGPEWDMEGPSLLTQALKLLRGKTTLKELASEMTIHLSELKDLLAQCVPMGLLDELSQEPETSKDTIVFLKPNGNNKE